MLKDKLVGALGGFGYVIFYIVALLLTFAPLVSLNLPFLVRLLVIAAVLMLPFVGELILFILWVWAFIVELRTPIDTWSIIFFVAAAVYIFTFLLPILIALFSHKKS